jgi:phosphatidylglycerol---prolipoprotein diacylglyceryl transferase
MSTFATAPVLAYWVHDLSPFVVRFNDTIGIRWYGLAYVLGFFGAAWLLQQYARAGRSQLAEDKVWDVIFALVIGVMVGGRLGEFLLYQPELLIRQPLSFFRVWEGGMASHGGFVGVALALVWCARSQKISFLHLGDLIASTTALGLMLGRIANFINGELWGKPSAVSWAVIFPLTGDMLPRHPSQIYQAALEGALLFAYAQWRFWRSNVVRDHPGQLAGEFLIGYALLRAVGEIFREPDGLVFGVISRGTFYSVFLLLGGVLLVWLARTRTARQATVNVDRR